MVRRVIESVFRYFIQRSGIIDSITKPFFEECFHCLGSEVIFKWFYIFQAKCELPLFTASWNCSCGPRVKTPQIWLRPQIYGDYLFFWIDFKVQLVQSVHEIIIFLIWRFAYSYNSISTTHAIFRTELPFEDFIYHSVVRKSAGAQFSPRCVINA